MTDALPTTAGAVENDSDERVARSTRDALVAANLPLAQHLARRFSSRGEPLDDLTQVASLALIHAAERFDPSLGFEFSTFATRTILGELKRHFRDKGWSVRAPRRLQELYLEVTSAIADLSQSLGRSPTVHELAVACERSDEDVLEAIEAGRAYRTTSLDAPDDEGDTLLDRIGEADTAYATVEQRAALTPMLAALSGRDRQILQLRFEDELTQSEIAARLGMSQMHVSRRLRHALDALRQAYLEEE